MMILFIIRFLMKMSCSADFSINKVILFLFIY